jgi:hypothetical protein
MKVIDEITDKGGKCFISNPLWGLAPESDTIVGIINSLGLLV